MAFICEIEFENSPQKVIYAGQMLRGSVRLTLEQEKQFRSVFIQIYGTAYCRWTEGFSDDEKSYTSKSDFLNETMYLVGNGFGGNGNASRAELHIHLFSKLLFVRVQEISHFDR